MTRDQAIAKIKKCLALAYMQAKHADLKDGEPRDTGKARKTDFGHNMAGVRAAKSAQLNRGVGGIAQRELLT